MICCTVLPGYIATVGRFLLKDCENTTLNYNPEFIAQGSIIDNFLHPDMVMRLIVTSCGF
jgi:UDP-glucose 6-dehydrogenase